MVPEFAVSLLTLFRIDSLSQIMISLVFIVGVFVWFFAKRNLEGDRKYRSFSGKLLSLCISVIVLLTADNTVLFFVAWCVSNIILVSLMVHKTEWPAAKASGGLAAKNFTLGALFLGIGLVLLQMATGQTSIHEIINSASLLSNQLIVSIALCCLLLTAMMQSAIFPFQRWLLSSLNSPTPVSAMMHAGLINGGGYLLTRFAPLYIINVNLLSIIFIVGISTAILGTLWKLMQHDIKRMLACSTMAQMGLMLTQCGLGLFPAAIAHLCWHGLFKASLFLGASGAAQDKRALVEKSPSLLVIVFAILSGLVGSYCFAYCSGKSWFAFDTTAFLVGLSFITTAQLALTLLQTDLLKNIFIVAGLSCVAGSCYGWSVFIITHWLDPLQISVPQPLNLLHIIGFLVLVIAWLVTVFRYQWRQSNRIKNKLKPIYVSQLNASQPDQRTITAHRKHYQF